MSMLLEKLAVNSFVFNTYDRTLTVKKQIVVLNTCGRTLTVQKQTVVLNTCDRTLTVKKQIVVLNTCGRTLTVQKQTVVLNTCDRTLTVKKQTVVLSTCNRTFPAKIVNDLMLLVIFAKKLRHKCLPRSRAHVCSTYCCRLMLHFASHNNNDDKTL